MKSISYENLFSLIAAVLLLTGCSSESGSLELVVDGVSQYQVVTAEQASAEMRAVANTLVTNLTRITGATFISVNDAADETDREILVGNTNRYTFNGQPGEYEIRTDRQKLILNGHSVAEINRAVAILLERFGCQKFARGYMVIPKSENILFAPTDERYSFAFQHREVVYPEAKEDALTDWYGLRHWYFEEGNVANWGEKLAFLIDRAEGSPDRPCLADPATVQSTIDGLHLIEQRRRFVPAIYLEPTTILLQCVQAETSPGDILIEYINQVADSFPRKTLLVRVLADFLPVSGNVQPTAENVEWIISTEELDRAGSITSNPNNAWFKDNLEKWYDLADNLVILDYLGNRKYPVHPYPNLRTLQADLMYFEDLGIENIILYGSENPRAELAELRSYIGARLLEDPGASLDTLMTSFTTSFYGAAGPPLKNYLETMQVEMRNSGAELYSDFNASEAVNTFMIPDHMDEYNYFFNQAETLVSNDPELSDRVKRVRLAYIFGTLEQTKTYGAHPRGLYAYLNNAWRLMSGMATLARNFTSEAKRLGIEQYTSTGITPDEYQADFEQFIESTVFDHIAVRHSTVQVSQELDRMGNPRREGLTDGIKGTTLTTYNWLGVQGDDFVFEVVLDTLYRIGRAELDFLNNVSEGIFLPKSVQVEVSENGTDYAVAGRAARQSSLVQEAPFTERFTINFSPRMARHIRVTAVNEGVYPDWHLEAGKPARVMTDELMVY